MQFVICKYTSLKLIFFFKVSSIQKMLGGSALDALKGT